MRRWPHVPRLRALPRAGGCGQRVHGVEHHDEFAWLGDAASHAVSAQLAAEKEYTQLHLQPLASAEMELYGQMASSIPAESESAPEPWGSYEKKNNENKQGRQELDASGAHSFDIETMTESTGLLRGRDVQRRASA